MSADQYPTTTFSTSLPNIPWEQRPAGNPDVIWRYSGNPIIPRDFDTLVQ